MAPICFSLSTEGTRLCFSTIIFRVQLGSDRELRSFLPQSINIYFLFSRWVKSSYGGFPSLLLLDIEPRMNVGGRWLKYPPVPRHRQQSWGSWDLMPVHTMPGELRSDSGKISTITRLTIIRSANLIHAEPGCAGGGWYNILWVNCQFIWEKKRLTSFE